MRIPTIILITVVIVGGGWWLLSPKEQKPEVAPEIPEQPLRQETQIEAQTSETPSTEIVSTDNDVSSVTAPVVELADEITDENVTITTDGTYRYMTSNGIPDHETGTFPNSRNPNAISEQDHNFRVTLNPVYRSETTAVQLPGVAINGIPLEPGTAEFWNNDPSSGWGIEAFQDGVGTLGIDWSNAHVQPNGTYHYHGVPDGIVELQGENLSADLIQVAWAADGFPMFYSQSSAYTSSYRVKSGTRPSGPGGTYDGTYTQDWEYVSGLRDLDECNGALINGEYGYVITETFPYISRCLHGAPDPSFEKQAPGGAPSGGVGGPPQGPPPGGPGGRPPLR